MIVTGSIPAAICRTSARRLTRRTFANVGIILADEIVRVAALENRARDDEAEAAAHEDRIERLARILQFAARRTPKPRQIRSISSAGVQVSRASDHGRSSMQMTNGKPSGTIC